MRLSLGLFVFLSLSVIAGDEFPLQKKTKAAAGDAENSIVASNPKSKAAEKEQEEHKHEIAGAPRPFVSSFAVYGTDRINDVTVKNFLGSELEEWFKLGLKGDPKAMDLEHRLLEKVKKKWGFAFAEFSVLQFLDQANSGINITLDVVESADIARRMPFTEAPKKALKDPAGLLGQWLEYEHAALGLVEKGEVSPDTERCEAFHCPFGHAHENLKKYEKIFSEGVKANADALYEVAAQSNQPDFRAAAVYLLAYDTNGERLVKSLVDRIYDPDEIVRNNALRVLGDIAEFHQEFLIPMKPVIGALDYPKSTDRSKAVYLAFISAMNSKDARTQLKASAGPTLLKLLDSKQNDQRNFSHGILRKISGKEYAATDVNAWSSWVRRNEKEISGSKAITNK